MRYACQFGFFEIDSMPNQPSMALCHSFVVYESYRGRGFGLKLKLRQKDFLVANGFTAAICTVQSSNEAQLKILQKCGWEFVSRIYDARANSIVEVHMWRTENV